MRMTEFVEMLQEMKIPFAYDHFAEGESPKPPFICYLLPSSNNFAADGKVYFKVNEVRLEVYTMIENANSELNAFALLFEFDGDVKHIRHVLYNCSASRPGIEGKTNEDSKEVQTETLTIKATPLPSGVVKAKTGNETDSTVYADWYKAVYMPTVTGVNTGTETA